jgi:sugar transferase EpsL
MSRSRTKRFFDLAVVLLTAPLWLPVIGLTALAVRARLGSPVLFRQRRPGLHGRIFELVKFRTMTDERGPDGQLLPDAVRLTRFGRFLRASSLDELPELFNILRGEMGLVGPRPLMVQYLERYSPEQARRHEVLPGITGWAQVNGRNALSWEDRFRMDVWYVDHQSFGLDCRILLLTIWSVLARKGISAPGEATMSEFRPSSSRETPC